MNARLLSTSQPAKALLCAFTASASLLLASASAPVMAQAPVAKAASQAIPVEPCRMLLGRGGIWLITNSGAKCQAGAPLMLAAASVDEETQQLCDFGKVINKTKAASMMDVDSVQCIFTGKPLPGSLEVHYGRIVNGKTVEITD
jgi:hypothetical protein